MLSCVRLLVTSLTAALQASLSITNSRSLLKLISTVSVIPSNHLILCCPLLLLPSIFPSIRVFSKESVLHIWWPKYWSFSFSISPSNEYSGLISLGWTGIILLLIHFKYSSVYIFILNSLTLPSLHPSPLATLNLFSKSMSLFLFCKFTCVISF